MQWLYKKKSSIGVCNLCLQHKPFSEDHVPPQAVADISEVEAHDLLDSFKEKPSKRPQIIQNGLKFVTICRDCNSFLGRYDKELVRFIRETRRIMRMGLALPEKFTISFKPNTILRALAGHLAASKLNHDQALFDEDTRNILFDRLAPIPSTWNAYYWSYPYPETVIVRDVAIASLDPTEPNLGITQIIKFFPLGFMFCDNAGLLTLNSLTRWRSEPADFTTDLHPVPFMRKPRQWPEHPSGWGIMLGSDRNPPIRAVRRRRRPKLP